MTKSGTGLKSVARFRLALVLQDETAKGERSNFNKLVHPHGGSARAPGQDGVVLWGRLLEKRPL